MIFSNCPSWHVATGVRPEALGLIPRFLSTTDPRPASEQFHERYAHGGGWHPFQGFALQVDAPSPLDWTIEYPGDPTYKALAYCRLPGETVVLFSHAWVCIVSAETGAFEIARMD